MKNWFINPKTWAWLLSIVLLSVVLTSAVSAPRDFWAFVLKTVTSETTWTAAGIVAAGVFGVYRKLKEVREKAAIAEGKADTARSRALVAENKAEKVAAAVSDNSDRSDRLESGYKFLHDSVQSMSNLVENIQEERNRDKIVIHDLTDRLQFTAGELLVANREINELKAALKEVHRISTEDKQQIIELRAIVGSLKTEMTLLAIDNRRLQEENRELKMIEAAARAAVNNDIRGQLTDLKRGLRRRESDHLLREAEMSDYIDEVPDMRDRDRDKENQEVQEQEQQEVRQEDGKPDRDNRGVSDHV